MKIHAHVPFESAEFQPDSFTEEDIQAILTALDDAIVTKFGKRWKGIQVDFDDINYTNNKVYALVDIWNNNVKKKSGVFEFRRYNNYWDVSDYEQHLNTTVHKFVDSL